MACYVVGKSTLDYKTGIGTTSEDAKLYGEVEDEIASWSGPKQPPSSPLNYDSPMTVVEPVMRFPKGGGKRRSGAKAASVKNSKPLGCETGNSSTATFADQMDEQTKYVDGMSYRNAVAGNNKRKFSSFIDTVPIRTVPPSFNQDEEEEILFWSGPPKPPRSPVLCNEKIFVTDPVFRLPRRAVQKDGKMKSTTASEGVHKIARNDGMFRDKGSTEGCIPESSTEKSISEEF